jgi:hypothetical protein
MGEALGQRGQGVGQRDRVIPSPDVTPSPKMTASRIEPPRGLEAIVGFLTPPACREVLLGDLQERYRSPLHYISDAWYAIPCVVYSRVRRTADPGILLMDAMLLYVSFIAAAWQLDRQLLFERLGLLRLAIPVVVALMVVMLGDAYARPMERTGKRSSLRPLMQATLAVGIACLAQTAFSAAGFAFALPWWIMISGGAFGVVALSMVGMLFPPNDHRPRGAG